jgi:hypothetical protein
VAHIVVANDAHDDVTSLSHRVGPAHSHSFSSFPRSPS